jgi:hypothetical protein
MQAPLVGPVLMVELTGGSFPLMIPMIAATVTATVVARRIDGYSIYTARLRARNQSAEADRTAAALAAADVPRARATVTLEDGPARGRDAARERDAASERDGRC